MSPPARFAAYESAARIVTRIVQPTRRVRGARPGDDAAGTAGAPSSRSSVTRMRLCDPVPQRPSNHVHREPRGENRDHDHVDPPVTAEDGEGDEARERDEREARERVEPAEPLGREAPSGSRARRRRTRRTGAPSIAPGEDGEREHRDRQGRAERDRPRRAPARDRRAGRADASERSQIRCASTKASPCPTHASSASGIHEEHRRPGRRAARDRASSAGPPGEERERGQERDALRPREQREARGDGRPAEPPSLGEHERRQREQRGRATPRRPHRGRATSGRARDRARTRRASRGSEPPQHQPVEKDERRGAGREGDDEARQQEVVAEHAPEPADEQRIEREERGRARRPVVAALGDAQVPVAVPARPDVDRRAELVQAGGVPAPSRGVQIVLEQEHRPGGERPEREPAPQEDRGAPATTLRARRRTVRPYRRRADRGVSIARAEPCTTTWLPSPHEPFEAPSGRARPRPCSVSAAAGPGPTGGEGSRSCSCLAVGVLVAAGIATGAAVLAFGPRCDLSALHPARDRPEHVRLRGRRLPARRHPGRAEPSGRAPRRDLPVALQGDGRDRGPALLRPRRHRRRGHRAGALARRQGREGGGGRLDDHAAARPHPVHLERADRGAEGHRGVPRGEARRGLVEAEDPRELPELGVLREPRLRRGGGGAHLLLPSGPLADAAAGGAARGAHAGAVRLQPVCGPHPRGRAAQRGARGDAGAGHDHARAVPLGAPAAARASAPGSSTSRSASRTSSGTCATSS